MPAKNNLHKRTTCIKEHASKEQQPRSAGAGLLLFFADCFFDWLNEQVDLRCTEDGLLVVCVIFSQLRLPNCLRTGLLLLFYNNLTSFGFELILLFPRPFCLPSNLKELCLSYYLCWGGRDVAKHKQLCLGFKE